MLKARAIDQTELPDFDEELGILPKDESDDEDIEIEIVEEEPEFLRGLFFFLLFSVKAFSQK